MRKAGSGQKKADKKINQREGVEEPCEICQGQAGDNPCEKQGTKKSLKDKGEGQKERQASGADLGKRKAGDGSRVAGPIHKPAENAPRVNG